MKQGKKIKYNYKIGSVAMLYIWSFYFFILNFIYSPIFKHTRGFIIYQRLEGVILLQILYYPKSVSHLTVTNIQTFSSFFNKQRDTHYSLWPPSTPQGNWRVESDGGNQHLLRQDKTVYLNNVFFYSEKLLCLRTRVSHIGSITNFELQENFWCHILWM